jgi:hypothetical protein
MEKAKYVLGQRLYTTKSCLVGRGKVTEIIRIENKEGTSVKYVIEDAVGRKKQVTEGQEGVFTNLAEAKALALQDLQALEKNIKEQLDNLTDKVMDKVDKEQIAHLKKQQKKK